MTGKLEVLKGGKDEGEIPDACPWCGCEDHLWSACPRVRSFELFGEMEGPSDVKHVTFHTPGQLQQIGFYDTGEADAEKEAAE